MIKEVNAKDLTEGDWLYKDIKVNGKIIKADWEGLSKDEIQLLNNKKIKVKIKQGIPFVPAFLIAFIFYLFKDCLIEILLSRLL